MRFMAAILASAAAVLVAAPPAAAHPGATSFSVQAGVTSQILVLVPADYGKPIDRVMLGIPATYHLAGAGVITEGWTAARAGTTVTWSGATIAANDSAVFSITGEATAKGQLIFPVTTHSPDGTEMHYTGGPGARDAGVVLQVGGASKRWTRYLPVIGVLVLALVIVGLLLTRMRASRVRG